MFGDEPRQIVRHRAPRRRLSAVVRPYPVVVAGLVTLASVPVLAAVLAGSASLTTSDRHSPVVADWSQAPVVVPGPGNVGASPTPQPPVGAVPTSAPSPTPTSPAGTGDSAAVAGNEATAGSGSNPRRQVNRGGGSDSRPGSAPRRSAPAPRPSNSGGSPPGPLPSAPVPSAPVPTAPPVPSPSIPGILPSVPVDPLPEPVAGAAASLGGAVGGLLRVLAS